MWGGYWENANLYWTQGTRQSLSWWKMELIGHQPEVLTVCVRPVHRPVQRRLHSGGILIIIREEASFPGATTLWLSVSSESPALPIPQGMWHELISHVWRSASWSFQTTHSQSLQGRGPFQAAFSPRVSYHLSGCFTRSTDRQAPIGGKQRQIWTCTKAGSTDHSKWHFSFQGWVRR